MNKSNYFSNFMRENTKKVNDIMQGVFWGFFGIGILIGILALLKVFKMEPSFAFFGSAVLLCIIGVAYILRYIGVSEEVFKYYYIFALQVVILFIGSNEYVGLYCIFILAPILTISYFDVKFTNIVLVTSYVVLVLVLYFISDAKVENYFTSYTRMHWFIAFTIGYTLEYIALSFGIKISMERIRNMVESICERDIQVAAMQRDIIASFAGLIESRDDNTGQHVIRTGDFVKIILDSMKENDIYSDELYDEFSNIVQLAAPLHDVGKITISDEILCKPGKLTDEEYEKIKEHTIEGEQIINKYLKNIEEDNFINKAREIVLSHHERWDGNGYPNKLKGFEIPLAARIMAVADVFDALISKRCYKDAIDIEEAFNIIEKGAGSQFDPNIVEAFLQKKDEVREMCLMYYRV